ncbi:MAG TPA: tetratricopeptide repeat protein [Rhodocyclaceae bacterium]|nr:tetratricopeptide repeat protein [Rhodocyclaceae bacterium]
MTTPAITNLEKLLNGPRDNALLRYSLGNEYLKLGEVDKAAEYFQQTVDRDPRFSAGWKLLGKALAATNRPAEALAAYERGIAVATERGDIQAAKEMTVFAKRMRKQLEA